MKELKNLASFVANISLDQVPEKAIQAAISCVYDSMAVAMGAKQDALYKSIQELFLKTEDVTHEQAELLGDGRKASLRTAVFLNAMIGHILEMDDVHTNSKTHIGTVVVPTAWTVARYLHKSGRAFLEAVIAGYEAEARIGTGFGVSSHRNLGWHATGTAGTFGAAAACGRLCNLTDKEMLSAFGLAGTQSCSTWAFLADGATNKILHPARAAVSGLEAVLLTKAGMRGSAEILNAADGGIFPMMSREYSYAAVDHQLGQSWEIENVDKKPYPCCRSTHCVIDAAIQLRKDCPIEDIEHVAVATYLVGLKQCGMTETSKNPQLPTEAKFSTPYTAACAFINGNITLDDFTPNAIQDPRRQALLKKITVTEEPALTALYPDNWGCKMTVTLKSGEKHSIYIKNASGSVTSPLTTAQLEIKAMACLKIYDKERAAQFLKTLQQIAVLPDLPSAQLS